MKFTIAIPAFKPFYLEKAIQSVIEQTFQDWELIILNDASPYNIESIVKQFNDIRIHYYTNNTNVGAINVVDNWNKCLKLAKGEYIMVIGDDDFLNNNNLEEYNRLISKYPLFNIYHGRTILVDPQNKPVFLQDGRPETESLFSALWEKIAGSRQQFIGDYLFKRTSLINNGGFYKLPLAWGSDEATIFKSIGNLGIANTNIPIFNYRINPYSITSSGNSYVKLQALDLYKTWLKHFINNIHPTNPLDILLKALIENKLENNFLKRKIHVIAIDLAFKSFFYSISWFWKRKIFKIPFKAILYAYVEAQKIKISKRRHGN